MNNHRLTISKKSLWRFSLFIYFCVALNADWVTMQILWWGSIVFLIIASIIYSGRRILIRSNVMLIWMAVFAFIASLSSIYALDASIVFSYLKALVALIFIYNIIYVSIKSPDDIGVIIRVYIFSTLVIGLYLLFIHGTQIFALSRIGKADSGNWNGNSVGMMMAVGFILSLSLMKRAKSIDVFFLLVIDAFFLYWIIVTGSRKAMIILVGGICLLAILLKPKKIIRNLLFLVMFGVSLFYVLMEVPYFYSLVGWRLEGAFALVTGKGNADNSSLERQRMIEHGVRWFTEKPLLGYGMDNYRVLYGSVAGYRTYAHNNFVEIAVDLGIFGLVAYYWIFIKIIRDFFMDKTRDKQITILFSVIIMYLVSHYALVAIMELPQNIVIICILAAQALRHKNSLSNI